MTQEQIAQALLDKRGYVVFGTHSRLEPSSVVPELRAEGWSSEPFPHPMGIVSETTLEDSIAQADMVNTWTGRKKLPIGTPWRHYYRVVAE